MLYMGRFALSMAFDRLHI